MSPSTMQASLSRHVLLPWSRLRQASARPARTREGFQRPARPGLFAMLGVSLSPFRRYQKCSSGGWAISPRLGHPCDSCDSCDSWMVRSERLPGSKAHGPKRSVQLLACTYPHPRNYTPAGSRRPLAKTRELRTGWLVAFADCGRRDGGRRRCSQPA